MINNTLPFIQAMSLIAFNDEKKAYQVFDCLCMKNRCFRYMQKINAHLWNAYRVFNRVCLSMKNKRSGYMQKCSKKM